MASRVSVCWICGVKPQYCKLGRDCGSFTGMAQQNATVTGLPEHGLVLSGTIAEPVLENLTGQRILAWALRWVLARPNVSAPLTHVCIFNSQLLSKARAGRAALAPGSSRAHRYEQEARDIAQGEAPVSVSLDLAMLDDGSVVGPRPGAVLRPHRGGRKGPPRRQCEGYQRQRRRCLPRSDIRRFDSLGNAAPALRISQGRRRPVPHHGANIRKGPARGTNAAR